jgi:hypothetical protein
MIAVSDHQSEAGEGFNVVGPSKISNSTFDPEKIPPK